MQMKRQKILELIHQNGKVKVNELSEIFKISEVTIRMDLADLEKRGFDSCSWGCSKLIQNILQHEPSAEDERKSRRKAKNS